MNTTQKRDSSETPTRRDRPRSTVPTSGGDPPDSDGDDDGAEECVTPFELHSPDGDPPFIPPLRFTAQPPERAAYEAAFRAAWTFPHDLMQVMSGIRKGLERGKKAAESRGESR